MKVVFLQRCSTLKQSEKNSLEAQTLAFNEWLDRTEEVEVIARLTEVKSGRAKNRPVFDQAIKLCKKHNATLVVSRFDRISRIASITNSLLESDIEFLALDYQSADKLTLGILAQINAYESRQIGMRTAAAIKVIKENGGSWGSYGKTLATKNKQRADDFAKSIADKIVQVVITTRNPTYEKVAMKLNKMKLQTRQGKQFQGTTVMRLMKRLDLSF